MSLALRRIHELNKRRTVLIKIIVPFDTNCTIRQKDQDGKEMYIVWQIRVVLQISNTTVEGASVDLEEQHA